METMEVDKSAMRRLINATDIQADAVKRGQMKRFALARYAEKVLNPEVNREVAREMMADAYPVIKADTFQRIRA